MTVRKTNRIFGVCALAAWGLLVYSVASTAFANDPDNVQEQYQGQKQGQDQKQGQGQSQDVAVDVAGGAGGAGGEGGTGTANAVGNVTTSVSSGVEIPKLRVLVGGGSAAEAGRGNAECTVGGRSTNYAGVWSRSKAETIDDKCVLRERARLLIEAGRPDLAVYLLTDQEIPAEALTSEPPGSIYDLTECTPANHCQRINDNLTCSIARGEDCSDVSNVVTVPSASTCPSCPDCAEHATRALAACNAK